MMKKNIYILIALSTLLFFSCKKGFLDVAPESYIDPDQLSQTSVAAIGSMRGAYAGLRAWPASGYSGHEDYGHKSILSLLDLMANDVVMLRANWGMFNYNYTGRVMTNSRSHMPWFTYYTQIKNANATITIINNLANSAEDEELQQVRGQALALRGYLHFMLARIYGPTYVGHESVLCIPINIDTSTLERKTVQEVYTQITTDIEEAISLLEGYERASNEYIDQSVARAFLADVYLEMGKYAEAAKMARAARKDYTLLTELEWKEGFYDITQKETMWGADINSELSTFYASFFSHFDNTNVGYAEGGGIGIDKRLYDAMSNTDYRKNMFIGPKGGTYNETEYSPYVSLKFRDGTSDGTQGDYIYLRSAAMYYIEAEGLARSGNETEAQNVLFEITSTRDPSYVKSTKTGTALINEIILQKRIELWCEGFDWFDLKRLSKGVERDYSGTNHPNFGRLNIPAGDNRFLFMIPQAEVDANPAILPNNPQ